MRDPGGEGAPRQVELLRVKRDDWRDIKGDFWASSLVKRGKVLVTHMDVCRVFGGYLPPTNMARCTAHFCRTTFQWERGPAQFHPFSWEGTLFHLTDVRPVRPLSLTISGLVSSEPRRKPSLFGVALSQDPMPSEAKHTHHRSDMDPYLREKLHAGRGSPSGS